MTENCLIKPMLAASHTSDVSSFPWKWETLFATPKIDGIRGLIVNGTLVSRSFKPIPNVTIRRILERVLPEGADGEITCGSLYDTTSVVMSENTKCTNFTFSWFDWAFPFKTNWIPKEQATSLLSKGDDINVPYIDRINAVAEYMPVVEQNVRSNTGTIDEPNFKIVPLIPTEIKNVQELQNYNSLVLNQGYEGVVVRIPHGRYKCGRSTINEGLMIKIKQYADCEAEIIGTEELMRNINEKNVDNFGNVKRSSSIDGMVRGNTLGAIVAMTPKYEVFKIGTGFTSDERDSIWANRDKIVGHFVKYKCATTGSKNLPRNPVFIAIRHKDDIN